ncbi:MAG: hypothetical protein LBE56_07405 [Tannerella sp.]|jgi:hypothetical protein|nr:hypothetical protein [Tannerella sp.]
MKQIIKRYYNEIWDKYFEYDLNNLYHITNVMNVDSILINGLKCNDEGQIFFFDNKMFKWNDKEYIVMQHIGANQIFLEKYAIFKINSKGIKTDIINDNVAEITSIFQFYINQDVISPKYLKFVGYYPHNYMDGGI